MKDAAATLRASSAPTPDPDWSSVRETVLMLDLAVLQIGAAMKDGNASVDSLSRSFAAMAGRMQAMVEALSLLPERGDVKDARDHILDMTREVSALMHQGIIAFQFYDKLAQRLAHVGHGLGALGEFMADPDRLHSPAEWAELQDQVRSRYSMREEVAMFEALMRGEPVQAILERYEAGMVESDDDVELF